jgi:hypothetical protein
METVGLKYVSKQFYRFGLYIYDFHPSFLYINKLNVTCF